MEDYLNQKSVKKRCLLNVIRESADTGLTAESLVKLSLRSENENIPQVSLTGQSAPLGWFLCCGYCDADTRKGLV